jgi:hypothetical protein
VERRKEKSNDVTINETVMRCDEIRDAMMETSRECADRPFAIERAEMHSSDFSRVTEFRIARRGMKMERAAETGNEGKMRGNANRSVERGDSRDDATTYKWRRRMMEKWRE